MKVNIAKFCIPFFAVSLLAGCKDWVTPEAEIHDASLTEIVRDDAYYEALRAYKKSDHAVSFGWYSEWGEGNSSTVNMLQAVPDSMDIISLWNNANLTPTKAADLKFVREVKGTKVVICSFIARIGCMFSPAELYEKEESEMEAYWGWKDGDDEAIHESIKKWTKVVADSLRINGFDGIDIDYEPGEYGGKLCRNDKYYTWFVEEMGKYIGPQSGTENIFILDGYITSGPNPSLGKYFDYFVSQAYMDSAFGLNGRLASGCCAYAETYSEEEFTNRFIVTENLESAMDCLAGGYTWCDSQGRYWKREIMPSLVGFADWKPSNGFRKGGFGGYRFSNERVNNPRFKWMRKAIQQQNPAPGKEIITDEDFK